MRSSRNILNLFAIAAKNTRLVTSSPRYFSSTNNTKVDKLSQKTGNLFSVSSKLSYATQNSGEITHFLQDILKLKTQGGHIAYITDGRDHGYPITNIDELNRLMKMLTPETVEHHIPSFNTLLLVVNQYADVIYYIPPDYLRKLVNDVQKLSTLISSHGNFKVIAKRLNEKLYERLNDGETDYMRSKLNSISSLSELFAIPSSVYETYDASNILPYLNPAKIKSLIHDVDDLCDLLNWAGKKGAKPVVELLGKDFLLRFTQENLVNLKKINKASNGSIWEVIDNETDLSPRLEQAGSPVSPRRV